MKNFVCSKFTSLAFTFFVPFFALSLICRLVLYLFALEQSQIDFSIASFAEIFAVGALNDLITYLYIITPISIFRLVIAKRFSGGLSVRVLTNFWHLAWIFGLCFGIVAELLFWEEFGSRFNFIAVDYLVYTREVVGNIIESYQVTESLVILVAVSLAIFLLYRKLLANCFNTEEGQDNYWPPRLYQALVFLILVFVAHSYYSTKIFNKFDNRFAYEISKNGEYSLFSAYLNNSLSYDEFYKTLPIKEAFGNLRRVMSKSGMEFTNEDIFNIERDVKYKGKRKEKNVVLIMIESFNHNFIRSDLAPNLSKLRNDSLFFDNLYATGTRTVRGLEAVTLSVPPTPGASIVRRPNNENLFSISTVLKKYNYDMKFIYGGHGYFDNMNYFFTNNGFKKVDRSDVDDKNIVFSNIWGISDEDLYNQTIREADKSYEEKKPFFSFVMTTSNHRPYTYPENRVKIPSGSGRDGAIQYTDYAVGKFLEDAKKKPWFKDTIFVIVADHCASSAGRTEVDIRRYHIPLFIYSPGFIKPRIIEELSSQMDVAPTIFGLMNISYKSRFYGTDILKKNRKFALLGTYQLLGYLVKNKLVVLSPQEGGNFYKIKKDGSASLTKEYNKYLKNAISYYQTAYYLFSNGLMKEKISK